MSLIEVYMSDIDSLLHEALLKFLYFVKSPKPITISIFSQSTCTCSYCNQKSLSYLLHHPSLPFNIGLTGVLSYKPIQITTFRYLFYHARQLLDTTFNL